jgi:hypothetical protein
MGAFIPYQSTAKLQNRLTNYFLYTKIHNYMIIKMGSLALIKAGGEKKILLGVVNATFLFFETSKLWVLFMYVL